MTEYNEGDLVEAVKGEQCHSGRIEARMDDLLCIGSDGYRLDYYTRKGFTLTVIEKAKPPIPSVPGLYRLDNDMVVERKADGSWMSPNGSAGVADFVRASHSFTRLAPVTEVLAEIAEQFEKPTARDVAVARVASEYGVVLS